MAGIRISANSPKEYRPESGSGISQLVQSAERYINAGRFDLALQQLEIARTLEPLNSYLPAIIERITALQKNSTPRPAGSLNPGTRPSSVTLAPTISDSFESVTLTGKELNARVKQLTSLAEQALEQGSVQRAFDSLFKAYLLDPTSPFVEACEKTVFPAMSIGTTGGPSPSQSPVHISGKRGRQGGRKAHGE